MLPNYNPIQQDSLKRQASAMTRQLSAIVDGYVAAHPRTTPDEIKPVIKCITTDKKSASNGENPA